MVGVALTSFHGPEMSSLFRSPHPPCDHLDVLDSGIVALSAKYTVSGISNRLQRAQTTYDGSRCHRDKSKKQGTR